MAPSLSFPATHIFDSSSSYGTCVTLGAAGTLFCKGGLNLEKNNLKLAADFTNVTVSSVALGYDAACLVHSGGATNNGKVNCIGVNSIGQLGAQTSTSPINNPNSIVSLRDTVVSITGGKEFFCVVFPSRTVSCWGSNVLGQLGLGSSEDSVGSTANSMGTNLPIIDLGAGETIVSFVSGGQHNCALLAKGVTKCFGWNAYGQLGIGSDLDVWGNEVGQMGDSLPAINWGTDLVVSSLALGGTSTCALFTNQKVKCFGNGDYGQLGNDDNNVVGTVPTDMGDNLPYIVFTRAVAAIAMGDLHTCVLTPSGVVYCFGSGQNGALGTGDYFNVGCGPLDCSTRPMSAIAPAALPAGSIVVQISCGDSHSIALLSSGNVYAWGDNSQGQIGAEYPVVTNLPVVFNVPTLSPPTNMPIVVPTNKPVPAEPTSKPVAAEPTNKPVPAKPTNKPVAAKPVSGPTTPPTNAPTHPPASRPRHAPPAKPTHHPISRKPTRRPTPEPTRPTHSPTIVDCSLCLKGVPASCLVIDSTKKNACKDMEALWTSGKCKLGESYCQAPGAAVVHLAHAVNCPHLYKEAACQVLYNPVDAGCAELCAQSTFWEPVDRACEYRGFVESGESCVVAV